MKPQTPKVAAIHDLSGFGRTSLMVVIPVLSVMGAQVCPLTTAVLSTHTSGYDDFRFVSLDNSMKSFLEHWKELKLSFDSVYSGFLGSAEQVDIVINCIDSCLSPKGIVLIDPVLGDNGSLDPTMSYEIVESMSLLIQRATCITPNLTEAALLLKQPYPLKDANDKMDSAMAREWMIELSSKGPELVVFTGVPLREDRHLYSVLAYDRPNKTFWKVPYEPVPAYYPGTGDTFASVLLGGFLQKDSIPIAMERAVQFVSLAIRNAFGYNTPHKEGIALEHSLPFLINKLTNLNYSKWDLNDHK